MPRSPSTGSMVLPNVHTIQNDDECSLSQQAMFLHCFNTYVFMSKWPSTQNLFIHIRMWWS